MKFDNILKPLSDTKWYLILCLFTVVYFIPIVYFSNNFPFYDDDYQVILDFLIRFKSPGSLVEKLSLFFVQHHDHRLPFTRLVALIDYLVFGEVNFKRIIFVGNLALPIFLFFTFKILKRKNSNTTIFLFPISIFLLNYSFWESSFWAMASVQNLWVYTFAIMSLYFLTSEKRSYDVVYALIFAACATYTSGNGIFILLAGNAALVFQGTIRKKILVIWNIFGILLSAVYFLTYVSIPGQPTLLQALLHSKQASVYFFFIMLGSGIDITNKGFFLFVGQFLFLLNLNLVYKKYYKINPIVSSILLFLLLTTASCALFRVTLGEEVAISSRYRIVSCLYLAFIVYAFVELYFDKIKVSEPRMLFICLAAICYVNYTYYANKDNFEPRHASFKQHELMASTSVVHKDFYYYWSFGDKTWPRQILATADSLGIFHSSFSKTKDPLLQPDFAEHSKIQFWLDIYEDLHDRVVCDGWALRETLSSDEAIIFYVIKEDRVDGKVVLIQPIVGHKRPDANAAYGHGSPTFHLISGFRFEIDKRSLPSGGYKLELYITDGITKSKLPMEKIFGVAN